MKKALLTTLIIAVASYSIFAQSELKLFLSDSLVFKDISGNIIADPFTGGVESPLFYNMNLNDDGKEDLVVFDKGNNKISTYINNGNATQAVYRYSPEFESFFPKGRLNYFIYDFDRDGFKDIVCGQEAGNSMLFYRNEGKPYPNISFTLKGNIAYLHYQPVAPGVKNYLGLSIEHNNSFSDIDNDGDLDFVTLSSSGGNLQYLLNRQVESGLPNDSLDFHLVETCFGYFGEGEDNSVLLNSCKTPKYYIRRHAGGTSILLIDLDKDGDKDLILGNNYFKNLLYVKNGYNDFSAMYDSMIAWDSVFPKNTHPANDFTFPMASYVDITGDGINDLVVSPSSNIDKSGQIQNTRQTMLYENSGLNDSAIFNFVGNNFLMTSSIDLGNYNSPAFYDYDGDGDQDLFIAHSGSFEMTGHSKDQVALYKNVGVPKKPEFQLMDLDFGKFSAFNLTYSRLAIYDFDKDGNYEFYFGQIDGTTKQFTFTGQKSNPVFSLSSSKFGGVKEPTGYAAPAFMDFNKDDKTDLVLGTGKGYIQFYNNTGTNANPNFSLVTDTFGKMFVNQFRYSTNPPSYASVGRSTPLIADLNGNNELEVISGSIQGELFAWKVGKNAQDTFVQLKNFALYKNILGDTLNNFNFGKNITVATADLDGDTIADLIVGNDAGGFYYFSGKARVFAVSAPKLESKKLGVHIYPNPTTGVLNIKRLPDNITKTITVFDITGIEIFKTSTIENALNIALDQYSNGIYLVRVKADGYQETTYKVSKL